MSRAGTSSALAEAVRRGLRQLAIPAHALPMQRYMKSAMPYHGVRTQPLRRLCREVFAAHPLGSRQEWQATVLELWRGASHREERYAAIELCACGRYPDFRRDLASLPLYEELVASGAWWDLVDPVASHRLRELLQEHPRRMTAAMRRWSRDGDLWKRRAAIICQLRLGAGTDLDLLRHCIESNLAERDFFIRKAIGWALRDLAWFEPDWVERYVAELGPRLSPLSRREALKNLAKIRGAG